MSIRYEDKEEAEILDRLIMADRIALFWDHFHKLPEDCQKVLRLTFDEATEEQIQAEMAFKNEGSVKVKRHRCKEKLMSMIKGDPRYKELAEDP